jgi:hypothetical protein
MVRSDTGLSFMKVGLISLPPFARAATAMLACSGVTAIPWPKETVAVVTSLQEEGRSGAALSGSSVAS